MKTRTSRILRGLLPAALVIGILVAAAPPSSAEVLLRKGCDGNVGVWFGDWWNNPDKINSPLLYEGFWGCCKTWHGYLYCETWSPLATPAA